MTPSRGFSSFPLTPRGNTEFQFADHSLAGMSLDPPAGGGAGDAGASGGATGGAGGGTGDGGAGQGGGTGGSQQGAGTDAGAGGQGGAGGAGAGAGTGTDAGAGGSAAGGQGASPQQGQGGAGTGASGTDKPADANAGAGVALTEEQRQAAHEETVKAITPYIERGIYLPTAEKPYDLSTDEGLLELTQDSVSNHLQNMVENLPDTAREFVKLALGGGSREELRQLAMMDVHLPDYTQYDLTKPEDQDTILRAHAASQLPADASAEDIDAVAAQLKALPDAVRLNIAKTAQTNLVAFVNQKRQEITQQATARQQAEQKAALLKETQTTDLIRKTDNIAGFPVPATDKDALIKFRYERGQDGLSAYDRAQTPENEIAMAYFLMKGFDTAKMTGRAAGSMLSHIKRTATTGGAGGAAGANKAVGGNSEAAGQQVTQVLETLGGAGLSYTPMSGTSTRS